MEANYCWRMTWSQAGQRRECRVRCHYVRKSISPRITNTWFTGIWLMFTSLCCTHVASVRLPYSCHFKCLNTWSTCTTWTQTQRVAWLLNASRLCAEEGTKNKGTCTCNQGALYHPGPRSYRPQSKGESNGGQGVSLFMFTMYLLPVLPLYLLFSTSFTPTIVSSLLLSPFQSSFPHFPFIPPFPLFSRFSLLFPLFNLPWTPPCRGEGACVIQ
jgi:hypothetical protein